MTYDLYKESNDYLSILNESEQLILFPDDMIESSLKYKRRTKRTISSKSYQINEPTEEVSKKMQKINSSKTKIELLIEAQLISHNIYYTKPDFLIGKIEGKPDFIIPKFKISIFCDGDFWHGYNYEKSSIKNNTEFWDAKIEKNILRDEEVSYGLKSKGWTVVRFWEHEIKKDASACVNRIVKIIKKQKANDIHKFTFIDLFSGIGGFRIPLEELGGKCLGYSEIDKYAIDTYRKNFIGYKISEEIELGSITDLGKLPFLEIDLIVGGVPCQSWSVAGKMRGFEDPRGKLWNDTLRVVRLNKPKAFIFENVKGLMDPRNRENLQLIVENFEKLQYTVRFKLLNSYDFGLPQNRDRIFIVGVRNDCHPNEFNFPKPENKKISLYEIIDKIDHTGIEQKKDIIDPKKLFGDKIPMGRNRFQKIDELNDFFIFCDTRNGHTTIHSWDMIDTSEREKEICMSILKNRRKKIYGSADGNPILFKELKILIPNLKEPELATLINKKILKHQSDKGYVFVNSKNSAGINGIYRIYLPQSKIFSTLTATGTKDVIALENIQGATPEEYKQNFINKIIKQKKYKEISAREAGKLQGFPNWFAFHDDQKSAKKQFGNAVSIPVIYHLCKCISDTKIFKNNN